MTDTDDTPGDASPTTDSFRKRVEIEKTDDEQRIALGVAMIPNEVDRQGDWETPETIQRASEGYMMRLQAGAAKSGIMHATFPGPDSIAHVENRVLEEPTTLGGTEYPAGTWVVGKKVHDDRVWRLVKDGTLGSFSIGGEIIEADTGPVEDLPDDVRTGDHVPEDASVRQLKAIGVGEISLVDYPGVPRADVAVAKADDLEKAADQLTAGVDEATEYLEARGHDEESARALAEVLNDPDGEKAAPGWFAKARRFFSGADESSAGGGDDGADATGSHSAVDKEGRTLSAANREHVQAIHDAALTLLDGAGVDTGARTRFTDDASSSFDFDSYRGKKSASTVAEPAESGRDPSTKDTTDMSDDTDDEPTQAEKNAEAIADLTETVKTLLEAEADEADAEKGEDTGEDDEPTQAEKNAEAIADLTETVKALAEANGVSQQTPAGGTDAEKTRDGHVADVFGL